MAGHRVCPWCLGYLLACPLRRLVQDPVKILTPYVREGMTVLEPGPGMGFFTLELARLVGRTGRVVAVDIQPKMISCLKRRLAKAGLLERVDTRLAGVDSMGLTDLSGTIDFVLAFAMVHELTAPDRFFQEVAKTLKPGGGLLLAEPMGHVRAPQFGQQLALAAKVGLRLIERPSIRRSHAALLKID
jgi:ubiquinone/menaquinone biosynthesis C-methylase UbiE